MASSTPRGERTEPASKKRLEEARKEGRVARGPELTGTCLVIGMSFACVVLAKSSWGTALQAFVLAPLRDPSTWRPENLVALIQERLALGLSLIFPLLLVAFVLALVCLCAQAPPTWVALRLHPERFNPASNLAKALKPAPVLARIAWGHAKLVLLVSATAFGLWSQAGPLTQAAELEAQALPSGLGALLRPALIALFGVAALLGLVDLLRRKWELREDLKMSKQELRDELRAEEGDPHVKARRKAIARNLARGGRVRRAPSAPCAGATIVLLAPGAACVALRYRHGLDARPVLVLKEVGSAASELETEARCAGLSPVLDAELAERLAAELEPGDGIAESHYAAIAAVISAQVNHRDEAAS